MKKTTVHLNSGLKAYAYNNIMKKNLTVKRTGLIVFIKNLIKQPVNVYITLKH